MKEIVVTQKRSVQQASRTRMARTGEKYTQAMRAVLSELGGDDRGTNRTPPAAPVIPDLLRPGSVTVVISGGGATNLAMVLPDLVALCDAGHPLVLAHHATGRGLVDLPSGLDFVWARGLASVEDIIELLDRQDTQPLLDLLEKAQTNITLARRPLPAREWREVVARASRDADRPPVIWVQDIQIDGPLDDYPKGSTLSEYDQVPIQLTGLKDLAEETNAIVAAGHVLPGHEPGWRVVGGIADDTIIFEEETPPVGQDSRPRTVQLRHLDRNGRDQMRTATIDLTFWDWRSHQAA